jgi:hypothetical protein
MANGKVESTRVETGGKFGDSSHMFGFTGTGPQTPGQLTGRRRFRAAATSPMVAVVTGSIRAARRTSLVAGPQEPGCSSQADNRQEGSPMARPTCSAIAVARRPSPASRGAMARVNKSGLPPRKMPMLAALRQGGPPLPSTVFLKPRCPTLVRRLHLIKLTLVSLRSSTAGQIWGSSDETTVRQTDHRQQGQSHRADASGNGRCGS